MASQMNSSVLLVVFSLTLLSVVRLQGSTLQPSTGAQVRITNRGFDLASKIIRTQTFKLARDLHFNVNGKTKISIFNVDYKIKDLIVNRLTLGDRFIRATTTDGGMQLKMHGISATALAKYYISTLFLSTKGVVKVSVSDVSADILVKVKEVKGIPQVTASNCAMAIGHIQVEILDFSMLPISSVVSLFESVIKKQITGAACTELRKFLKGVGNAQLRKLPFKFAFDRFAVDYSLSKNPQFAPDYVQTYHTGAIYVDGKRSDGPFKPAPFPVSGDSSKMTYIWLSESVANQLAYAAYTSGSLTRNFGVADIVSRVASLNCTDSVSCLATFLPSDIANYLKILNASANIELQATRQPIVSITPAGIAVTAGAKVNVTLNALGATLARLDVGMNINAACKLGITNETLYGVVRTISVKFFKTTEDMDISALDKLAEMAIKTRGMPLINDLLKKGIVLPIPNIVRLYNNKLTYLNGTIMAETDVSFQDTAI